jgi:hypothetical protein
MDKYPEHDQEYFYKFTSMDTANLILKNGSFRYSSPASFNDPFDIQTELYFDFEIKDFPRLVTNEIDALVCGRRVAAFDGSSDWCKAIVMLQEQNKKGKYRRNHLDFLVEPLVHILSNEIEITRKKYNEHWCNQLKKLRVFCLSAHNQSILMWSHYAQYHTGVCFKLKVLPEKDNSICAAKKVDYLPDPPSFFKAEAWIDSIVLNKELEHTDLYYRYPLSKSKIWEYEDEWRVWAPFENDGNSYIDIPIVEGEIEAIYFGVNADHAKTKDLMTLAQSRGIQYFFCSEKRVKEYGLKYNKI